MRRRCISCPCWRVSPWCTIDVSIKPKSESPRRVNALCFGYLNEPTMLSRKTRQNTTSTQERNILEENSQIVLTSLTIVACLRPLSTYNYSILIPKRWLVGNSHTLSKHNWSFRSMVRVLDIFHDKMSILSQEPKKIMDESFMMNFFNPLIEEILPFKECLDYYYNSKKTHKVVRDRIKHQPHLVVKNE